MLHLIPVTRNDVTPEVTHPDPSRIISGTPIHTTWNVEERGNIFAGLWHSTPGKWRIAYDEWEYFRILEGISVITDAAGQATTLRAGDSWVIRPGFSGSWEVLDATLKDYVIVA
jgi:uncharacterized protein